MPARKRAKRAKFRGTRTCGWGKHTRHRGHGSQGGTGMAGSKKHKKTWIVKYAPGHIGKRGFSSLAQRGISKQRMAVNVSDLESMAGGKKEVGFDGKILGGGSIGSPLTVKAHYFTDSAKAKIEKAGGEAVVVGEGDG